jgi:hypothetical protein
MTHLPTAPLIAACALLLSLSPPATAESVVLIQESNGFPGGEKTSRAVRQQIVIDGPKLRVLDPVHMWALFIDLDERKVREAAVDRRTYIERDFEFYEKYRRERQKNLAAQAEEWLRLKNRLDPRKDRARLRRHIDEYTRLGGDPQDPGKIEAKLQYYPQDRRTSALRVGREVREIVLEHYVIRENQAARPIFDLWITHNVDLPVDTMRFYRELGTFSPEVTAQLQKVPGTIIQCTAQLDTGTLHKTFRSRVLEVRPGEATPGSLTIPQGWSQEDPDAQRAVVVKAAAPRTCAICSKEIEEGKAFKYRHPRTHKLLHTCSKKHRIALIKRVSAELKKQQGK